MTTDQTNMVMPVAPYGGMGGGFGGFGGDGWWLILLLLCFNGGWGGFGGFGGAGMAMMDGGLGLYPWLNNSQNLNDGFRDQMLNSSVNGIQNGIVSGFGDVQTALCGGFAGVNASINGAQNAIAAQLYGNQIASLDRSFAAQTAVTQGMTGLSSQLSQCCCDNRLATVQTQNIVQAEGAATRLAIQNQTQAILDKMCQQEIDAYKRENDNLRTQINMQNLAASQATQTAALIADNTAQTQYIVNRVAPYPIPAYTVANPVTPATA
jgi:hypothetical protein